MCLRIRTLILPEQDSAFMTSFNLTYLLTGPLSKYSHMEGLEPQHTELQVEGDTIGF